MKKKHILILGDATSVLSYLNFFENQYSIITSVYESNTLPSEIKFAANVFSVETPDNFDVSCFENRINDIFGIVSEIIERHGEIDCVVTTYEHTVLAAAMIRTHFNIPGLKEDRASVLRDKNKMKTMISNYGIIAPNFKKIEESTFKEDISNFLNKYKKIVIKPSNQAGSHGVLITDKEDFAISHTKKLLSESNLVSVEQFIDLPIMHFDGVMQNGEIKFLSVSKKIGTCYDYVNNKRNLTTIVLSDKNIYREAKKFVEECLRALKIDSIVFHLEVFQDSDNFIFLEIAGRYPGGGISRLIKKVFNFDFVKASYDFDCQLEIEQVKNSEIENIKPIAMLIVPMPVKNNILIKGIKGLENLPNNIVGSEFQGPGQIVNYAPFEPFNALGRLFVSDEKIEDIEKSVQSIDSQVIFEYINI